MRVYCTHIHARINRGKDFFENNFQIMANVNYFWLCRTILFYLICYILKHVIIILPKEYGKAMFLPAYFLGTKEWRGGSPPNFQGLLRTVPNLVKIRLGLGRDFVILLSTRYLKNEEADHHQIFGDGDRRIWWRSVTPSVSIWRGFEIRPTR